MAAADPSAEAKAPTEKAAERVATTSTGVVASTVELLVVEASAEAMVEDIVTPPSPAEQDGKKPTSANHEQGDIIVSTIGIDGPMII